MSLKRMMRKLRWRLFLLQLVVVVTVFTSVGIWIYFQAQARFIANRVAQAHEAVSWALTNTEPIRDIRVNDISEIGRKLSASPSADFSFFLLALSS